ncbi:hypothetical protein IV454_05105 [Massilia antarctica]|uniref:Uncharacterized protein n=1 Tax=Massilia antarctica TaxID=2765360 RepID=A0AA49A982_9BURK|nr:hypothetical protein [Massilia antarctica]QPI50941.1 hypothetical protein IV454_05105 [Massilia antarctica]
MPYCRTSAGHLMKSACITVGGCVLAIVLVDSADTLPERGPALLARLQPYFPALPIMLVSIEDNGFRAFATFQTSELLALVQLENVNFVEVDVDAGPAETGTLPF